MVETDIYGGSLDKLVAGDFLHNRTNNVTEKAMNAFKLGTILGFSVAKQIHFFFCINYLNLIRKNINNMI